MSDRVILCPRCEGHWGSYVYGCDKCNNTGTIPDRRKPTANDRAVERIKTWLELPSRPDMPQHLREAEEYVSEHLLDIIREEAERE